MNANKIRCASGQLPWAIFFSLFLSMTYLSFLIWRLNFLPMIPLFIYRRRVGWAAKSILNDVQPTKLLLNWREANRLDINRSKIYAMFVTNKRLELPAILSFNGEIEVVQSLKLLVIKIEIKVSFSSYVANVCKMVNKKNFLY